MGDIESWMDETYVTNLFTDLGVNVVSVRIIRDNSQNRKPGYCFIEFSSNLEAKHALDELNGKVMGKNCRSLNLKWAASNTSKLNYYKSLNTVKDTSFTHDLTIYVGDLDLNLTEEELQNLFNSRYSTIISCKLITDTLTKKSRGYGFINFKDPEEFKNALIEMNGLTVKGKSIRVNKASNKRNHTEYRNFTNSTNTSSSTSSSGSLNNYLFSDSYNYNNNSNNNSNNSNNNSCYNNNYLFNQPSIMVQSNLINNIVYLNQYMQPINSTSLGEGTFSFNSVEINYNNKIRENVYRYYSDTLKSLSAVFNNEKNSCEKSGKFHSQYNWTDLYSKLY